jgi:predicted O-methyltransferase YrrM
MSAILDRLLPSTMRNYIHLRSELRSLAELRPIKCNTARLRSDLPNFAGKDLSAEWDSVRRELDALQLGDKPGAVNPGDRRAIYYLTRTIGAKTVLEVGTHLGASTSMLALALRNSRLPSPKLTTVDILDVNGPRGEWARLNSRQPKAILEALKCEFAEFVTSPSLTFLKSCTSKFDLIFLDGLHKATTVYQEVPAALELLNPGGLILLHDFFPDGKPLWSDGALIAGPWLAVNRHRNEGSKMTAEPLGALPWPTKAGSNVTSLACLIAA